MSDILIGRDLLNIQQHDRLLFDEGGLQRKDVEQNDIFVRAGPLAALVKKHLYDGEYPLVQKKHTDANTFTKTFKLGFRLKPLDTTKRVVFYVKLLKSLQNLRAIVTGEYSNLCADVVGSCKHQNEDVSESMFTLSQPTVVHRPVDDVATTDTKVRMETLLKKWFILKTKLADAQDEIRFLKSRGVTDHVDLEQRAIVVNNRIDVLLTSFVNLTYSK